jgi:hypothetical protein
LIWIISRCITLFWRIRRNPQMMIRKSSQWLYVKIPNNEQNRN